jgi:hypothetical protein
MHVSVVIIIILPLDRVSTIPSDLPTYRALSVSQSVSDSARIAVCVPTVSRTELPARVWPSVRQTPHMLHTIQSYVGSRASTKRVLEPHKTMDDSIRFARSVGTVVYLALPLTKKYLLTSLLEALCSNK